MREGEPDIRSWKVTALHNQEIGRVTELLFDDVSHRIRYIIVELNGKPLNLVSRTVIIPSGLAVIHEKEKLVAFPGLTVGHLASLPGYEKGKITIETEREIRTFCPLKESFIMMKITIIRKDYTAANKIMGTILFFMIPKLLKKLL